MSVHRSAAALIAALAFLAAPSKAETRHVVELFTSQGCSSCPPADAVLEDLAARPDVLALGFHVDYWDRLGWKDTLGDPAYSARQRAYAVRRGDGRVYTPQAIVDGGGHTVGSSPGAISRLMGSPLAVDIRIDVKAGTVAVGKGRGSGTLWRVDFTRSSDVAIHRGENRGRTVSYAHAVRGMTALGRWDGRAARFDLGRCGAAKGADECAVILQAGTPDAPGPILGAATF